MLALCWRGELACWAGDEDLIDEYAPRRVWEQIDGLSPSEIGKVTAFFALTTDLARAWSDWGWDRSSELPRRHLGMVELISTDIERPLAIAIVRGAMQSGRWDTSLLCSILQMSDYGSLLEADDLPPECWVWMAENVEHSWNGDVYYYMYWNAAFRTMGRDSESGLFHNVMKRYWPGLLFNKCQDWETPPSSRSSTGSPRSSRPTPRPTRGRPLWRW